MEPKKKGVLITNSFLHTQKFSEHYEWLKSAAERQDMVLDLMGNADHIQLMAEEPHWLATYDFVLFWDKDIRLGKKLEQYCHSSGIPIYNSVESIATCDDKYETYLCLQQWNRSHPAQGITMIPTIAAPMTYDNIGYPEDDFLRQVEEVLGYPMVMKECFGSFGMQVYLASDFRELQRYTQQLTGTPFIFQKYLAGSSGRDVRLQVVGNKVVAAMYRQAQDGDFRANITNGGSMKAYAPSQREQEIAITVCKALGLTYAGVDLLFDISGQATILCEVNSNAHFKNIYTCTGTNVADEIMNYVNQALEDQ